MKTVHGLLITAWFVSLLAAATVRQPPTITKFLAEDLISPNEVSFQRKGSLVLPCAALGSNLTWTWKHNDKVITRFLGNPYLLGADGTLTGNYLAAEHSGTYQCFVKDQKTGVEVFSRKLRVAVTVVGKFINTYDVVKQVSVGRPFRFQCPKHSASFGATYNWVGNHGIQFSRNKRRAILPNGDLYIMFLTQEDIDEIKNKRGIKCNILGANTYRQSGCLKLARKRPGEKDRRKLFPPSWVDVPFKKKIAVEGRDLTLYCLATGRPAPRITWKRNGQKIIPGQNSYAILNKFYGRRLDIHNVNITKHQGQYTCEAENSQSNGKPLIHSVKVQIEVPPRWTKTPPPRKMDLFLGGHGELECHVTALPTAKITWYKSGLELPLNAKEKRLNVDGDKLHLKNITQSCDGVYQCVAENRHGMIVSATWVNVQALPAVTTTTAEVSELLTEVYTATTAEPLTEVYTETITDAEAFELSQPKSEKKSNLAIILGATFSGLVVFIMIGFVSWKIFAKRMTSQERLLKEVIDEMEEKWKQEHPEMYPQRRSKVFNLLPSKIREFFQRRFVSKIVKDAMQKDQENVNLHSKTCELDSKDNQTNLHTNVHESTQEDLGSLDSGKTSHLDAQEHQDDVQQKTSHVANLEDQRDIGDTNAHQTCSLPHLQTNQEDIQQPRSRQDMQKNSDGMEQESSNENLTDRKESGDIHKENSRLDVQEHQENICEENSDGDAQEHQRYPPQEPSQQDEQGDQADLQLERPITNNQNNNIEQDEVDQEN